MSSVRVDVHWSPLADDQFLTWGSDLQLYQVQEVSPTDVIELPRFRLGPKTAASLLATNNDLQYIKCVAWCPGLETDLSSNLIAVGQANGKVALTNFSKVHDPRGIKGKEFIPKHTRPVNSLSWNTQEPQLLAAGLDRGRSEPSVIIWDVTRGSQPSSYGSEQKNSSSDVKPMVEFGLNETCQSLAFSMHTSRTLIAGMNNKHIKLFDIRDSKLLTTVSSKAVYGICTDPHNEHRFASFVDQQVHIWDFRNIERPVLYLDANKPVVKLAWCPSRANLLGSLGKDSSTVRIHDVLNYIIGAEDQEPAVVSRSITPDLNNFVSAFSWHPNHENRLLTASYTGKLFDNVVHERITLNWSVTSAIVWTNGKKTLQHVDNKNEMYAHLDDISTAIMTRAKKRYGLFVENLASNGDVTDDMSLKNLWTWLDAARSHVSGNFKLPGGTPYRYHGVLSLMTMGNSSSDVTHRPWVGLEGLKTSYAKVFRSEERIRALELCSWGFDNEAVLNSFLNQLEATGNYTRAVAIAVFNQRIRQAIQILQRGAKTKKDPGLNSTAMALSGYTEERKGLWRETCTGLRSQLSDPYLRAMFAFLTDDADSYDPVLSETEIAIQDRVAFACSYLSDSRLKEYLERLNARLTEEGNLDGILLTGLCSEGIDLLQRYVDLTGDVQTVALVTIHALQHLVSKDTRLAHWVQSYRSLLDSLRLWNERAELDVIMNKSRYAERPPQHVYITCTFCMKSISAYIQAPGRPRNPYARFGTGSANKSKMQACPNCRKPLPRCSLCLVHMGTVSGWCSTSKGTGIEDDSNANADDPKKKLANFMTWFTWCQTCRHGGHAQHLMEWFKEHTECPVTQCNCKCMLLDTVSRIPSSST
ncbi:GATOR2 complex protein MIOS-A [Palaemon carinicauda]|uniref:GATOR2 complex protein MIOS-A n=1 Tax=Palaemon carinicauda TaxID=392227 RepID=UPI0035B625D6